MFSNLYVLISNGLTGIGTFGIMLAGILGVLLVRDARQTSRR